MDLQTELRGLKYGTKHLWVEFSKYGINSNQELVGALARVGRKGKLKQKDYDGCIQEYVLIIN